MALEDTLSKGSGALFTTSRTEAIDEFFEELNEFLRQQDNVTVDPNSMENLFYSDWWEGSINKDGSVRVPTVVARQRGFEKGQTLEVTINIDREISYVFEADLTTNSNVSIPPTIMRAEKLEHDDEIEIQVAPKYITYKEVCDRYWNVIVIKTTRRYIDHKESPIISKEKETISFRVVVVLDRDEYTLKRFDGDEGREAKSYAEGWWERNKMEPEADIKENLI